MEEPWLLRDLMLDRFPIAPLNFFPDFPVTLHAQTIRRVKVAGRRVSNDFDEWYYFLAVIGHKTRQIASHLLDLVLIDGVLRTSTGQSMNKPAIRVQFVFAVKSLRNVER